MAEEGVYEVEDLLGYQLIDGKHTYLVKWKGFADTSWEPDENIGDELSELKSAARQRGETKRKRGDKDKKEKKEKKKKRRRDSSDSSRRKARDSDSSRDDDPMGLGGMMPGFPGMHPGMHGMMPGMMPPGFDPHMPPGMMPGMMHGGMGPMGPMGHMGKGPMGMGPPMMGKGPPMGPWGFDPMGKGMPPMGKGKPCMKGPFGKGGPPHMGAVNREALDMQRFAIERKRALRDFAGVLHGKVAKEPGNFATEKLDQTKQFQDTLGLQLEGHQLPVMATTEMVVMDALWLLWLYDPDANEQDRQLLMNIAKLARASQGRARQLLVKALRQIWPKPGTGPSGRAVQLFSMLGSTLPKFQGPKLGDLSNSGGPGAALGFPDSSAHSPEFWRELITSLYTEHNPSKLGDVDALLTKYRGRERTLYLGICEKYKVQPKPEVVHPGAPMGMPPMPPGMPGFPPPPGGAPANAEHYKKIRELICEVYREHNPSKLDDVDSLLEKYKGREEAVYRSICDKYKVEVKLPAKLTDGSAAEAPVKSKAEQYKELIIEVYKEHNKEKLSEIDDILKKYEGKEKTLYVAICTKYKIEPKLPGSKKKKNKAVESPDDQKANEERVAKIKPLICEVYQAHNPSKLEDVDSLMAKYKGREELLYHSVCEKYSVEPKIPKPGPGDDKGEAAAAKEPKADDKAADDKAAEDKDEDGKANGDADASDKPSEKKEAAAGGEGQKDTSKEESAVVPAPTTGSPVGSLRQAYSELIREVYREHNPSKLDGLDKLLDKYLGQEQNLYLTICKKYNVKAKDPEGLGDLDWMHTAEEELSRLLEVLVSFVVLHSAGLKQDDAKGLAVWEQVRRKAPPRLLSHCFELSALAESQFETFAKELHGEDGARVRRLKDKCLGAELNVPQVGAVPSGSARALTISGNGGGPKGRTLFDHAVATVTDVVVHAVRDCLDQAEGTARSTEKWVLPWKGEEVFYVMEAATPDGDPQRREVGVEYRRGCLSVKRRPPLHSHSAHHSLCGPDVESRLPGLWRDLADKLWAGIAALKLGSDLPLDVVVVVDVKGGHSAVPPCTGVHDACTGAAPSAAVVISAPTELELEQAKGAVSAVLSRVLSDLRMNALFAPTSLNMPQLRGPRSGFAGLPGKAQDRRGGGASSSSSSEAGDDESEEIMSDVEPGEGFRPLRLPREKVRDAYLQGLLCLNCDAADHKHQDCPFKKKVCWNCHGNHAGNDCPLRCRFCKDRHDYPLLECVKKVCRRVSDWKKSKPAQEQRGVLSSFEQLSIKLEGFEDLDLAKHNRDIQKMVKELAEHCALWPEDLEDIATSILDMKPPQKKAMELLTPPPPPGLPPKPYVAPKLPKESPPTMPENKYPWQEKIFLDSLLTKGMYGSNVLSRIIGRGGANHRRMETESGARVFFRGLGVSGRDADMTDPMDGKLHIAVKGEVPQQGKSVRRIIADIIAELDAEIAEKGEVGPRLDRPRDPDLHPFGFMLPKGTGPDVDGPLKFKFPEEDGQVLNDVLVWLKQAKLPLELDSDTQWRTSLQVTPTEPALPDDAPEEAERVADAFEKLVDEWHYPSPYWFEEHDLQATGLWTALTSVAEDDSSCPIAVQQGQGVRLSSDAVSQFAMLLDQADLVPGISRAALEVVLRRLRGVVRRQVLDEELLLYLNYPWAWFSESMSRGGLRLPYGKERVHEMLVDVGRVGGKPTETCPAPPFRGFSVEWMPVKPGAKKASMLPLALQTGPPLAAPVAVPVPQDSWHADLGMPVPMSFAAAPAALPYAASAAAWHGLAPPSFAAPPMSQPAAPAVHAATAGPKGYCKCWLPDAIFSSGQDLVELIAGPGGAHFQHVLKKYPMVELKVEGQNSTAAPPAHRLHVVMCSEDSEIFESAAADVLDLVETVCDMVGEELGLSEEQVEELIQGIRAEKYFEAHGIRTPLPPVRARSSAAAAAAAPMAVEEPAVPQATADVDFEFIDDVVDNMQPAAGDDGDDTEDDAATEESEGAMSEVSEDEAPPARPAYDDL